MRPSFCVEVGRRRSGVHFGSPALVLALGLAVAAACDRGPGRAPAPADVPVVAAAPVAEPAAPVEKDVTPPTAPQNLDATVSPGTAELTWTGSSDDFGVEGYDVFRGDRKVARVARPQARDEGLVAGQRYCYTVVGFDAAGNRSAASAEACVVAPDVTAPTAPADLAVRFAAPTEASLRWTASTDDVGVAGYEVLRGDQVISSVRQPSAQVGKLAPGRRHCFSVRAVE